MVQISDDVLIDVNLDFVRVSKVFHIAVLYLGGCIVIRQCL